MSKTLVKSEVEEIMELLALYFPAAKHAVKFLLAIHRWAKHLEYPINSFAQLIKEIHHKPIEIDEKHFKLEDLTGPIPAYYFPIANNENLIEKVMELYLLRYGFLSSRPYEERLHYQR